MAKKKIETRISEEKERLMAIFENLDPNQLETVQSVIDRMAFITVSLQDLERVLVKKGWTETYQNGEAQSGVKKSAEADVHISLTKNLNALTKQLVDLCPPAQRKSKLLELMEQ